MPNQSRSWQINSNNKISFWYKATQIKIRKEEFEQSYSYRSSTEAELIAASDGIVNGLWLRNLLTHHETVVYTTIMYSAILT